MRITVAVTALGTTLLAAACGGSPATTSAVSAQTNRALAFARCMRSHGVPSFPDPNAQGRFPAFRTGVSKQVSATANDACKHLLPSGGTATPAQQQQKLAFGVKVAGCLRRHGFPDMPDPTRLGANDLPPGIDPSAPQFQSAETACEQQARAALGLP